MAVLRDKYLWDCVYLYKSEDDALEGARGGPSGCLVNVRSETDPYVLPSHRYVVTNDHVRGQGFDYVRYNTWGEDSPPAVECLKHKWEYERKDDLAVAAVEPPRWIRHTSIGLDHFSVTHEKIEEYNIGVGDDVFMVSRFLGHEGKERYTPVARFGNISLMPDPRDPVEFEGLKLEAYLVEMRSLSGHSGSPVFWYVPMHSVPDGRTSERRGHAMGPLLLGIDCGHITDVRRVRDADDEEEGDRGWHVRANTGMAVVIPVWRLRKLLDRKKVREERMKKDERRKTGKKLEEKRGSVELDFEP